MSLGKRMEVWDSCDFGLPLSRSLGEVVSLNVWLDLQHKCLYSLQFVI